jgi:hypothetical protein
MGPSKSPDGAPAGGSSFRDCDDMAPMERMRNRAAMVVIILAAACATGGSAETGTVETTTSFIPAHFQSNNLIVFPFRGPAFSIEPPPSLKVNFSLLGSSPDGRTVYGQSSYPNGFAGLISIDFGAKRIGVVPGSIGLGSISSIIESPQSGEIFVSARMMINGAMECGDFEIDPKAAISRPLRIGRYPDCGGPMAPDGRRELTVFDGQLRLRVLETGASTVLGTGFRTASWSPNGQWITAVLTGRGSSGALLLIDASDTSRRKKFGSIDGQPMWSPDSKLLAAPKSQFSCGLSLYGQSLEVINIETGAKAIPASARCRLFGDSVTWVANNLAHN